MPFRWLNIFWQYIPAYSILNSHQSFAEIIRTIESLDAAEFLLAEEKAYGMFLRASDLIKSTPKSDALVARECGDNAPSYLRRILKNTPAACQKSADNCACLVGGLCVFYFFIHSLKMPIPLVKLLERVAQTR